MKKNIIFLPIRCRMEIINRRWEASVHRWGQTIEVKHSTYNTMPNDNLIYFIIIELCIWKNIQITSIVHVENQRLYDEMAIPIRYRIHRCLLTHYVPVIRIHAYFKCIYIYISALIPFLLIRKNNEEKLNDHYYWLLKHDDATNILKKNKQTNKQKMNQLVDSLFYLFIFFFHSLSLFIDKSFTFDFIITLKLNCIEILCCWTGITPGYFTSTPAYQLGSHLSSHLSQTGTNTNQVSIQFIIH